MSSFGFVFGLGLLLAFVLRWGFEKLPKEHWQIIAAVPLFKDGTGRWHGINLTYYGLLVATAIVFGVAMCFVLLGAIDMGLSDVAVVLLPLLALCIVCSKYIAKFVEKQEHTFTVGGAAFVGIFLAPWVLLMRNGGEIHPEGGIPIVSVLAVFSIAYAIGEGLGRLACISYGCCYGKPLEILHPFSRWLFSKYHFVFSGEIKKSSSEGGFNGKQLIPIQGITAVLYLSSGLVATYLFLLGQDTAAFLVTSVVTQGWRALSEFWRSDYRGEGRLSCYQKLALFTVAYTLLLSIIFGGVAHAPTDISAGLARLWSPIPILTLQGIWLFTFLFYGRSTLTRAELSFHLNT